VYLTEVFVPSTSIRLYKTVCAPQKGVTKTETCHHIKYNITYLCSDWYQLCILHYERHRQHEQNKDIYTIYKSLHPSADTVYSEVTNLKKGIHSTHFYACCTNEGHRNTLRHIFREDIKWQFFNQSLAIIGSWLINRSCWFICPHCVSCVQKIPL